MKYVVRAVQNSLPKKKRARKFFAQVCLPVIIFFLSGDGASQAAELKKFTLGYSIVGPAGTGLWMAKEMGDLKSTASTPT